MTRSLSDMGEWRAAARVGSMMTMPFIESDVMNDLRDPQGKNEMRSVAGLRSMMPATRNRLRGDSDLVTPTQVTAQSMADSCT